MKKAILCIISLFLTISVYSHTGGEKEIFRYEIRGGKGEPYCAVQANLMQVWMLNGLSGAELSFSSDQAGSSHQWFKYKTSTKEVFPVVTAEFLGNTSVIRDIEDGFGYYVGTQYGPGENAVMWVIDYSLYLPSIISIQFEVEEDEKCEAIKLLFDIEAKPLTYYLTNGIFQEIKRHFYLEYNSLEWNDEIKQYETKFQEIEIKGVVPERGGVDAPLINTTYTLRGDQFARHFGEEQRVVSAEYNAVALNVHTFAYVITEEGEDMLDSEMAYEAPLQVRFESYSNDISGLMHTWKIFKLNPMTGERESSESFRYTTSSCETNFTESGTYDVVLEVKVPYSEEMCSYDSEQLPDKREFRVILEESYLKLPNAFSPGSSFGSNDVYKISSKSLISFKASIFNRWGNLLYTWTDPEQGWDGRVNGKYVPTGVYFIIVEAKGADGKIYKKSSDINILRSKN